MNEPRLEELMARIEVLEQEKRRWKGLALGSLAVFLLLLMLGGLLFGTTLWFQTRSMRAEQIAVQQALRAAEVARMQAERARQAEDAWRRAEEKKE